MDETNVQRDESANAAPWDDEYYADSDFDIAHDLSDYVLAEEVPCNCGTRIEANAQSPSRLLIWCPRGHRLDERWRSRSLPPTTVRIDEKPSLRADSQVLTLISRACESIARAEEDAPRTFSFNGELVRVKPDGRIERLNETQLSVLLADSILWFDQNGEPADPPSRLAYKLLKLGSYGSIPILERVLTVPVLSVDGSIVTKPGYDRRARTYLALAVVETVFPPDRPTSDDLANSLRLIDELLYDFPFVDTADRANAIALLLLPFVRNLIDGPTPLHWVGAPTAGTGKGKLVESVLTLGVGTTGTTQLSRDEPERRKAITTVLRSGAAAVKFDNVDVTVRSASLEAALTEDRWQDRLLGGNSDVDIPIRCIWTLTANNAQPGPDMRRRIVPINLDAKFERPELRAGREGKGWLHPLPSWAREHRTELVRAALTICQSWVVAGMSRGDSTGMGSYEEWKAVMSGLLDHCGVDGFLTNRDTVTAIDPEREELAQLHKVWDATYGSEALSTRQLIEGGELRDVLAPIVTTWNSGAVGTALSKRRDVIINGRRLVVVRKSNGDPNRWRLESLDDSAA